MGTMMTRRWSLVVGISLACHLRGTGTLDHVFIAVQIAPAYYNLILYLHISTLFSIRQRPNSYFAYPTHRVMARSKWISFKAQEQLDRAAAKAMNASTISPLPSSADAKKFGLENVGLIIH